MRDDGGWTTLWILGLCMLLFGLAGISVDLWKVFGERRALAAVADSAAIAGGNGIDVRLYESSDGYQIQLDPPRAESLARSNIESQTDRASMTRAEVAATPERVVVRIEGSAELTLLRLLSGRKELPITVTGTANPRGSA